VSQPTEQRPPQVTLASGIVMFASAVALLTAWELVSSLGSLEMQETIASVLADPPFSGTGLDMQAATDLLRIVGIVSAVCACATGILGWYVRRPDRHARLALTLFAVPLFVTGLPAGGLAGSFVAAGAAMLWMPPAREWFATGKWTPPAPARESEAARRTPFDAPPRDDHPTAPPPAARPFGEPPAGQPSPYAPQPPYAQQPPYVPHAQQWQQRQLLNARPSAMVAAFVITVVMAGGLLVLSLLWIALAGLSPDFLMRVLEEQQPGLVEEGVTLAQVRSTVFAYAGAFVVWCLLALALAGFAMARRAWARRGLMASAAFSAGGCLVFALDVPLVLIPAAAAVATVACLRRVEVRRWFAHTPR
jgi:hypothetical protein